MATGRVPTTANSPLTAKGDLFGYSTTQARVAVGNNGETLVADSSTSTGLRYTAGTVNENPTLNSAFQVWQRGTSYTNPTNVYTADRWFGAVVAGTVSRQTTSDTTNLPFIQYCVRVQRTSGSTSTSDLSLSQSFESLNSIPYAGKTVTLSFYARAGANYSSASNALGARVWSGTGTDQNLNIAYTGATFNTSGSATLTTTWQRFTFTGTVASTATEIALQFFHTPTGTAGANDYYELTGVQIDIGSVALPFRTNGATIQGELSACQRYYYRKAGTAAYQPYSNGFNYGTTQANLAMALPVTMRTSPTMGFSAANTFVIQHTSNLTAPSSVGGDRYAPDMVQFFAVATGLTAGQAVVISNQTGQTGFIEMIAEL